MTIEEDLAALNALQAHLFAHRHATTSIMFAGETTDPAEAAAPRARRSRRSRRRSTSCCAAPRRASCSSAWARRPRPASWTRRAPRR